MVTEQTRPPKVGVSERVYHPLVEGKRGENIMSNATKQIATLQMRNGAVGIGGYPVKVRADVRCDRYGDETAYVSARVWASKIANDNLVVARTTSSIPVVSE
jgi:hypothetical protein